ncbi:hypothetical protein LCGC14_1300610 [marine sediment metagenome]|uniref:SIS domain-containing protein n=1 Tax=marine sediment metagenome TaxID=412755 RepID=A0A0F9KR69_9ZZZZ
MDSKYISDVCRTLKLLPLDQIEIAIKAIDEARTNKKWVYLFGNGGSAANASHLANGLQKVGVKTHVLDNTPIITAIANDTSYDKIFSEQLKDVIEKGDIAIGISCSGNSKNVLRAVEYAKYEIATTIGLTAFDGGELKDLVDIPILVPVNSHEQAEDIHSIIGHMITLRLGEI